MLTILACPKPFVGSAAEDQYTAIRSWLSMPATTEVILYGDADGVADAARDLGVGHVPNVDSSTLGTPLFGSVAQHAERCAKGAIHAYVNCDIRLTAEFATVSQCALRQNCLIIGQRLDMAAGVDIDVRCKDWRSQAKLLADSSALSLHPPYGSDYFIFPRGLLSGMRNVVIGRACFDNAIIAYCLRKRVPVVDATSQVPAFHPFHGYGHVAGGEREVFRGAESAQNRAAMATRVVPITTDASHVLADCRLRRSYGRGDWIRHLTVTADVVWRRPALSASVELIGRLLRHIGVSRARSLTAHDVVSGLPLVRRSEIGAG